MIRPAFIALSLMLAAIVPMAGASAQGLSGAVSNIAVDSSAPIHIEADTLEIDEPNSTAVFLGTVRVKQDTMQLSTDELRIHYQAAEGGGPTELRTIDAVGKVVVTVEDQVAKGDTAHYEMANEEVILSGNVVLSQGDNVITGEQIIVDLRTSTARVVSTATAAEGGERVRAVFTPTEDMRPQQ